MLRQNAQEFRSRCVLLFCTIGLEFIAILLLAGSSHAGVLTASWTAPITNSDGSAVTELAFYRVYYSASNAPQRRRYTFPDARPEPFPAEGSCRVPSCGMFRPQRREPPDRLPSDARPRLNKEVRAVPTHVGVALVGTILFAISVIFRVWG